MLMYDMKKIVMMLAALLVFSTADANAQGFLKKLKPKIRNYHPIHD